jgi:hypothetical protein
MSAKTEKTDRLAALFTDPKNASVTSHKVASLETPSFRDAFADCIEAGVTDGAVRNLLATLAESDHKKLILLLRAKLQLSNASGFRQNLEKGFKIKSENGKAKRAFSIAGV